MVVSGNFWTNKRLYDQCLKYNKFIAQTNTHVSKLVFSAFTFLYTTYSKSVSTITRICTYNHCVCLTRVSQGKYFVTTTSKAIWCVF